MITSIIKRDGRETVFDQTKIADAIEKAFQASGAMQDRSVAEQITDSVMEKLEEGAIEGTPTVEGVQDLVEEALIEANFSQTAKAYILYRAERNRVRDVNSRLVQTLKDITFSKASDSACTTISRRVCSSASANRLSTKSCSTPKSGLFSSFAIPKPSLCDHIETGEGSDQPAGIRECCHSPCTQELNTLLTQFERCVDHAVG